MTTSIVTASFQLNDGSTVDLYNGALTESTDGISTVELQTSTKYAVGAISLGTFADGKTITAVTQPVTGTNAMNFAYIERRGAIICILPVASRGVQNKPCMPMASFRLQAGDTVQVCAVALATKSVSYSVVTASGVQAIFGGLSVNGSDMEMTHILSGQGIGASLTGQQIVSHVGTQTSANSLKNTSAGVYVLNDRGLPVGNCPLTVTSNLQPIPNAMGAAMIQLNFVARVSTSA